MVIKQNVVLLICFVCKLDAGDVDTVVIGQQHARITAHQTDDVGHCCGCFHTVDDNGCEIERCVAVGVISLFGRLTARLGGDDLSVGKFGVVRVGDRVVRDFKGCAVRSVLQLCDQLAVIFLADQVGEYRSDRRVGCKEQCLDKSDTERNAQGQCNQ